MLLLSACAPQPVERFPSSDYNLAHVTELARRTLGALQAPSFAENREFCGVIGIDPKGEVRAAPPTKGSYNRCVTLNVPREWIIIASYHTHGGYDPQILSEVPSVQDIRSVAQYGLIGFVSTPGGRFWLYDGKTLKADLICGVRCLDQDPAYRPDAPVRTAYTLQELMAREDGQS